MEDFLKFLTWLACFALAWVLVDIIGGRLR